MEKKTIIFTFVLSVFLLIPFLSADPASESGGPAVGGTGMSGGGGLNTTGGMGGAWTGGAVSVSVTTTTTTTTTTVGADVTAPTITIVSPTNDSFNSTSKDFNITLNEAGSWCGYSLDGAANVSMENSSTTAWGKTVTVTAGGRSVIFSCNDSTDNMGSASARYFTIDTTAATISGGSPTGTTSDNTPTLSVTTNENANCQYGTSSFVYGAGTDFTTTGTTSHSSTLTTALSEGSQTYYASCNDTAGNLNTTAYTWSFTVDAVQEHDIPSINATASATVTSQLSNTSITFGGANTTIEHGEVNVTRYDTNPSGVTPMNGTTLKYVEIVNSSDINSSYITWFLIEVNYTAAELASNNVTESTVALYWWNDSVPEWQAMSSNWDWVWDTGIDTTNNVVWANTTHFSYYSLNGSDTSAPIISSGSPTGTTIDTTPTISVTTNEDASCAYSTSDVAYASMTAFSTTGGQTHSSTLSALSAATYTYYARCQDAAANTNTTSYTWSFTVSTTGAGGGGGITATTTAPATTTTPAELTTTTPAELTTTVVATTVPVEVTTTPFLPPLPPIIPGAPWWLTWLVVIIVVAAIIVAFVGYQQGWFKGFSKPKKAPIAG